MAGASITIEYDDRQVVDILDALAVVGTHMETVFSGIGEYLLQAHEDRFAAQEAPDGTPWQPLSPKYRARKKKNPGLILVLDGYLKDTLAYNADDTGLEFGSNRIYAATQQFGADDRGIPARPFLGISADDNTEILDIVESWLLDIAAR